MRTGREVSVLVHRDGCLLLMRRARDGIWHIPAGGADAGETNEEAARRELFEESGLRVDRVIVLGHMCRYPIMAEDVRPYPPGVAEITHETFAAQAPAGWQPLLDAEHTEHRWVPFDEAPSQLYFNETREAFELLRTRLQRRGAREITTC